MCEVGCVLVGQMTLEAEGREADEEEREDIRDLVQQRHDDTMLQMLCVE